MHTLEHIANSQIARVKIRDAPFKSASNYTYIFCFQRKHYFYLQNLGLGGVGSLPNNVGIHFWFSEKLFIKKTKNGKFSINMNCVMSNKA